VKGLRISRSWGSISAFVAISSFLFREKRVPSMVYADID
jgi:hypothetical protein